MKVGKQTKREARHTAEAMAAGKELMITALGKGLGPGDAAEALGLGRSTVYEWKREDIAFSAKWEEAVETSLDRLETVAYNLALGGDFRAIEWNLKWRRKDVYQNSNEDRAAVTSQTNYFLNADLQEHYDRLARLGLPAPVIEPDYEVIDAADSDKEKDNP
jgi:hypothetical protein